MTNVFPVRMRYEHALYQYHVDFNPAVPSSAVRKAMLREHKDMFGNFYMFDGMQLFLQFRLENDVSSESSERVAHLSGENLETWISQ